MNAAVSPSFYPALALLAITRLAAAPAPTTPTPETCDTRYAVACTCRKDDGGDDSRRLDDSSPVLPKNNAIADIVETTISSFTPDPLDVVILARPGSGGTPPVYDWNLIFEVRDQSGSNLPDFTNGGFLWARLRFDEFGTLIRSPQWWVWDRQAVKWQAEQMPPLAQPALNEQFSLQPVLEVDKVALQLRSFQPVVIANGQPLEISGLRVATFGQDLASSNPGPTIDSMPDPLPLPGNPPIGQGFITPIRCNP